MLKRKNQWGALSATLLGFSYLSSAQALQVGVSMSQISIDGISNINDPSISSVSFPFSREVQADGNFGPIFDSVKANGIANGINGTLGAEVHIVNVSGTAGNGTMTSARISSVVRENIRILDASIFGVPDGFHSGLIGLGDPNDDFWTVTASAKLIGSGSVGSATGVPPGFTDSGFGLAELTLGLGIDGLVKGSIFSNERTTIDGTTGQKIKNEFTGSGGFTVTVDPTSGTVTMNIPKSLSFNSIFFSAQLSAEARVGFYPGAEANADYGHTAYLSFDVEEGASWSPRLRNKSFLSDPATPPSAVPIPATAWMFAPALAYLFGRRRRWIDYTTSNA